MKFADLHLHPQVFEGVDAMGFDETTPVQEQVIPVAMEGRDLIACAQTGTGKTAAYILPLLHHLTSQPEQKIKALILAPTRELVMQIDQQFQGFAYFCGVESIVSFVFPMFIGLIAGCYSSIFIAGPAWTVWKNAHPDKKKSA